MAGTCWLISNQHVVTNYHVHEGLLKGARDCKVKFTTLTKGEIAYKLDVEKVLITDETCDVAIYKLELDNNNNNPKDLYDEIGPLELHPNPADLKPGEEVGVIGHPKEARSKEERKLAIDTFGKDGWKSGCQFFSPGKLISMKDKTLEHNCATLPGFSGSPVIELKSRKVIALHSKVSPTNKPYNLAYHITSINEIYQKCTKK
jgi:V8-like Glu-specific endopeptidase